MNRLRLLPSAVLVAAAILAGGWIIGRALDSDSREEREGAKLLQAVMDRVRDGYVEEVDEEKKRTRVN